ncbi:uncharacterized protein PHALS_02848 [Plasmopara halstedii]|uniref:Uncharacterized protein n=1 Tax=Plasmopara halstedii TaxID=4781 RepID=A0A0P1AVR1_PLAHL|nr:uncharacterized protein PHALS_02848 [Plasmopara halstedii]CEG46447.1 hypothetical protein PHALS_02848 [Plasmopara halstedii]|eukprot:XP_024582816.1 hypothetical protein PHALS_02848 [Plasmopara halstedii]
MAPINFRLIVLQALRLSVPVSRIRYRNKVFFRLDFAPRNNLATLAFQELELKRYPSENNVTDEPRRSASLPPPTLFVID